MVDKTSKEISVTVDSVDLEFIGAGFGRTGTMSLKVALEILGFGPCHHMMEVMCGSSRVARQWLAAVNGAKPNWDVLLKGYRATVDWPSLFFLPELMEKYPSAKVILTERDAESWYTSASSTIFKAIQTRQGAWVPIQQQLAETLIIGKTFHHRVDDKKYAMDIYESHLEWVRAYVPSDRLITLDVSDGWQGLCSHLDLPLPDKPFPHSNRTQEFNAKFQGVPC